MLSETDLHLFYKLLDSLSGSLRDLASKFALLSRDEEDRKALVDSISKLSILVDQVSRDSRTAIQNSDGKIDSVLKIIQPLIEEVREISEAVSLIHLETGRIDNSIMPGSIKMADIVARMDLIDASFKDFLKEINDLNKNVAPLTKLANQLSKPIAWILLIYMVLMTIVGFAKGVDWVKEFFEPEKPAIEKSATP